MKMSDVRIDGFRTAVEHWTGSHKAVHLPSGIEVPFDCDWSNYHQKKDEAVRALGEQVEEEYRLAGAGASIADGVRVFPRKTEDAG